jgi:adenine-specific DNA-methyltransferase
VDEYAIFCVPDLGLSVIQGSPSTSSIVDEISLNAHAGEEEDEGDEYDTAVETDEEGDEIALDKPPFPEEEADLWELRHARRRGGESSYRHQRWNQFYPLWIDKENRRVVKAGQSIPLGTTEPSFRAKGGLVPLWPIDADGNHRCWRFISTRMQQLIDERRVVLGRYNKERDTFTVNIWERKPQTKKLKTVWWETKHDAGTRGTTLLHKLLGKRDAFPFPKSIYAVRDTIAAVVRDRPDAVILDFFCGKRYDTAICGDAERI